MTVSPMGATPTDMDALARDGTDAARPPASPPVGVVCGTCGLCRVGAGAFPPGTPYAATLGICAQEPEWPVVVSLASPCELCEGEGWVGEDGRG